MEIMPRVFVGVVEVPPTFILFKIKVYVFCLVVYF
ncbi:hypothetical protein ISN45_At03g019940 [Arabidopsis thaliana x Arabidopsis arenosa]|uniref:Transmembrane protein n=4 Tax=Arabidopsis TaxID=3701 RepID=A0A5S9XDR5_ARATH|nr:uncharacterized protein AT3G19035 [Arabidopsis thaliana]AEE76186.1 transmembrane protein [Arabidopsis thaliana]KAG7625778.1 hypothetical protein ISN45_At03g019940 [Arabidopsis thaliana x Arabidopsis arenosa]KAG7631783.1 hypothetical protein ISN44_As03g019830 [Arabidopsis suecica]CAA0382932.1 unnamed protein product [Arabidopsis thaliana]|eukprot:NP_001118658.1 transmembrane protein [Arabidopsis thaliana]